LWTTEVGETIPPTAAKALVKLTNGTAAVGEKETGKAKGLWCKFDVVPTSVGFFPFD
jgi:hypothetical protein